jgi:enoyl-CoA hydratase/carnithine racemase
VCSAAREPGVVRLGVRRGGALPMDGLDAFDMLLCDRVDARRPWVGFAEDALDAAVAGIAEAVSRQPLAAAVAAQVHRLTLGLDFEQALLLESLAYSTLLASAPFRAWRRAMPVRPRTDGGRSRVAIERGEDGLRIRLTRPRLLNAVDAAMRDQLTEALAFARDDPDGAPVLLTGEGPAFSIGGDLSEFGCADDVGLAHLVRTFRAPARLAHALGQRLVARVHGACIGAGIEIPAAAWLLVARPDARFRLPELAMGLIPGAGGTVSIPHRIGRHRACFLAISGHEIDVTTARAWGLVDAIAAA